MKLSLHRPLIPTYVTGGSSDNYRNSDNILEYRHGDGWGKVGKMKNERSYHATSLVGFEKYRFWCEK